MADSKSDLRARIRAARSAAARSPSSAGDAEDLLATARAGGLLDPHGAAHGLGVVAIAAYIAAPGEPDVSAIRRAVRGAGGIVLLPIPRPDRTLDWACDDGSYRPDGRLPIEVPTGPVIGSGAAALLAHGVQTVLVPALAVDATGARLGQGGGYYDRLLSELAVLGPVSRDGAGEPSAAGPRVVAVVRDEELLPAGAVPREAHDQVLTAALTPSRFVQLAR